MAGWPILTNGYALDSVKIVHTFRSIGFCLDIESSAGGSVDNCNDKLRCLFNQILSVFLKEVVGMECIRPCPATIGDGRVLDLFKLFWFVRGRGGYDRVSKNNMWALVLEECGFDVGVTASVKLTYFKYLYQLDQWFGRAFRDVNLGSTQFKYGESLDILSLELGTQFKGLLTNGNIQLESDKIGRSVAFDIEKRKVKMWTVGDDCKMNRSDEDIPSDDDEKICNDVGDVLISEPTVAKKICDSRKRKRGCFSGMLNWVTQIAKQPDDQSSGDEPSKEFQTQALLAREARLLKRQVNSDTEPPLLQKKLKMHPSMYDDTVVLNQQSREGLRCSVRLSPLLKSHSCPCCKPNSVPKAALASPRKPKLENCPEEQSSPTVNLLATPATDLSGENVFQKQISVGPLFQAKVPDWTGEVFESDSKWLGTRIYPPETEKHIFQNKCSVGKGRLGLCGCQLPGSVNCVRFHVAEKRMKLKLELGAVFYIWRFHRMGEEVSLSWTAEEEMKFKNVVRLNPPSLDKCFWEDMFKCFPTKTRENLVSYYFNVFLVHRRSYQNRVTPESIDSDDDESEFGSLSDGFGLEAINVPGSTVLLCTQNKECFDLL